MAENTPQPVNTAQMPAYNNPLDEKTGGKSAEEPQIIQNIVTAETAPKESDFLDIPPEIDPTLLTDVAPPKSILLLILKIVFAFLLAATVASVGFFTFQLGSAFDFASSTFGLGTKSDKIAAVNAEILLSKTEINFYNYLQAKAYLDKLDYFGDTFIKNYETYVDTSSEDREKELATNNMDSIKIDLRAAFNSTKDFITYPFATPLINADLSDDEFALNQIFQEALIKRLENEATKRAADESPEGKREYKNYIQTIKLVSNTELKNIMSSTDFEALDYKGIYDLIRKINALTINDLSVIQDIKNNRVKWSDVMKEIERRTIEVDPQYNDKYYDELGGIRYTSYDFDKESKKISIIGETKIFGTKNFTMISNLIDALNGSAMFESAEMKSFSKTGSLSEGYTASLSLVLDLQDENMEIITEETPVLDTLPSFVEEEESLTR